MSNEHDLVDLIADVAVLKSQGTEINRRLGNVDGNFKTLYGKIDSIMEAVNENKGASKQDIAFWTRVAGISGALSAVVGFVIKHL